MALKKLIDTYCRAWCSEDASERELLLADCWAEHGQYQDPSADISGRVALAHHIADFHHSMPGARIELSSPVSAHHDSFFFAWCLVQADGIVAIEGYDFGQVDAKGRINRIIGFFGPPGS